MEFFAAISIAILAIYFGFSFLAELNFGSYGAAFSLFTGLFILMLAPEFYQPLRDMGTHYHAKAQAIGAADALKTLLEYQVEGQVKTREPTTEVNWALPIILQATRLSVYSHDGTKLVGPLSFTLEKGLSIALVGPSGAGKSSLNNALLGFYPINKLKLKQSLQPQAM